MRYNLQDILTAEPDIAPDHIVALREAEAFTWQQLHTQALAWQSAISATEHREINLFCLDAFQFLAALLGIWRSGRIAVIPPDNLTATCARLAARTELFIGDFAAADLPKGTVLQPSSRHSTTSDTTRPLPDLHTTAMVMFTSGSSGEPQPIAKTFAQIQNELIILEATWGAQLQQAVIAATVSHQHIYGLFFRLLWPLCAARPILVPMRQYWEEVAADLHTYSRLALVSSPAHLHRVPELCLGETYPCQIFSSGAPLAPVEALRAADVLHCPITEIYGSTETGGIGWKLHTESHWQAFTDVELQLVEVETEGGEETHRLLQVVSSKLPDAQPYCTQDRAQLHDADHFSLLGRADRLAKLGAKRISLTQVEVALQAHPLVAIAKVLVHPGKQDRLAAVVELAAPASEISTYTKQRLNTELVTSLRGKVDSLAIPRYWRYVDTIPKNSQGKIQLRDLEALFDHPQPVTQPIILSVESVEASIETPNPGDPLQNAHPQPDNDQTQAVYYQLVAPAELCYFDGHFPEFPVLPGVVQTHWAIEFARERWPHLGDFRRLEALKFHHMVTAGQNFSLQLRCVPGQQKIDFRYYDEHRTFSSGRAFFSETTV